MKLRRSRCKKWSSTVVCHDVFVVKTQGWFVVTVVVVCCGVGGKERIPHTTDEIISFFHRLILQYFVCYRGSCAGEGKSVSVVEHHRLLMDRWFSSFVGFRCFVGGSLPVFRNFTGRR